MPRVAILKARAGSIRNGRFVPRSKNVAEGFVDAGGSFHPIRSSSDYDAGRAGEESKKRAKRAKKPKAKAKKAKRAKVTPKRKSTTKAKAKRKPTMRAGR